MRVVQVRGFWWNGRYYPCMAGGAPEGDGGQGGDGAPADTSSTGGGASTGGTAGDTAQSQDDAAQDDDPAKQQTSNLTKALNAERDARRKAEAQLRKIEQEKVEATRLAAEQKGEFAQLYAEEKTARAQDQATWQQERAALEAQLADWQLRWGLVQHLQTTHPAHAAFLEDIEPVVRAALAAQDSQDAAERLKVVKSTADGWVARHPVATEGRGAPSGSRPGSGANGQTDHSAFPAEFRGWLGKREAPTAAGG